MCLNSFKKVKLYALFWNLLGGFSMGGALALHSGYHVNPNIAGVFACSSFLNDSSVVFETLKKLKDQANVEHLPKLLMYHGDRDSLVPQSWGKKDFFIACHLVSFICHWIEQGNLYMNNGFENALKENMPGASSSLSLSLFFLLYLSHFLSQSLGSICAF